MIENVKVILASKSPRRRELLSVLVPEFEIIVREVDETLPRGVHAGVGVGLLAIKKGEAVAAEYPEALVISSDTLVELDGVSLGKPVDKNDACRMLRALSGRRHNVHTGVAVHYRGRCVFGVDSTGVIFRDITEDEIRGYVEGGEPMDKAGAYGIQGEGGKFVSSYDGAFDTVMGLSVSLTRELIDRVLGGEDDKE